MIWTVTFWNAVASGKKHLLSSVRKKVISLYRQSLSGSPPEETPRAPSKKYEYMYTDMSKSRIIISV